MPYYPTTNELARQPFGYPLKTEDELLNTNMVQAVLTTIEQARAKLHQAESIRDDEYPSQPAYVDVETVSLLDRLYDHIGGLDRELQGPQMGVRMPFGAQPQPFGGPPQGFPPPQGMVGPPQGPQPGYGMPSIQSFGPPPIGPPPPEPPMQKPKDVEEFERQLSLAQQGLPCRNSV